MPFDESVHLLTDDAQMTKNVRKSTTIILLIGSLVLSLFATVFYTVIYSLPKFEGYMVRLLFTLQNIQIYKYLIIIPVCVLVVSAILLILQFSRKYLMISYFIPSLCTFLCSMVFVVDIM